MLTLELLINLRACISFGFWLLGLKFSRQTSFMNKKWGVCGGYLLDFLQLHFATRRPLEYIWRKMECMDAVVVSFEERLEYLDIDRRFQNTFPQLLVP